MTKFILHGGGEGQGGDAHDGFFREIIKNIPSKAKILCVYFAVPEKLINEKHEIYKDYFLKNNLSGKEIKLKIASKENFIQELQWADAVYFRGGDTAMLLNQIKNYKNFKEELLRKKIVAGSSAGVYFLGKYAFSASKDIIYRGLGILPIKANCHYDKSKDLKKLEQLDGELLLLAEGEYKVMEIA